MIFCLENSIKIYLNDDLKIEYTDEDNPCLSGSIGIAAALYGNNEPSHIHFDDIKVEYCNGIVSIGRVTTSVT